VKKMQEDRRIAVYVICSRGLLVSKMEEKRIKGSHGRDLQSILSG